MDSSKKIKRIIGSNRLNPKEIKELEDNKAFYRAEIQHDTTIINGLKDSSALEKFAREEYFMKKKNLSVGSFSALSPIEAEIQS